MRVLSLLVIIVVFSNCNNNTHHLIDPVDAEAVEHTDSAELIEHYKETFVNCESEDSILNQAHIDFYTDKVSYFPGETVRFYVHCKKSHYSFELFRIGKNTESIYFENSIKGEVQNFFCFSYAIGCNWKNNYSYTLPVELRSGLYSAKMTDLVGNSSWFSFIVKPLQSTSEIMVLANTNTWQAYNAWGGGSFYSNLIIEEDPAPGNLSFLRPNPGSRPIREENKNMHLADAESYLLEWLENENEDYDLYADIDLHNSATLLSNYKLLILHAHPEYWSHSMVAYLKTYLLNGGNLMYLGGNGIYWKVVINTQSNIIERRIDNSLHDFIPISGGRWKDGNSPESSIIGVSYDSRGYGTFNPYRVMDQNHWVFANTNLKKDDLFGEFCESCGGASGHETDKVDLNSPSLDTLAIGTNLDNGGAYMVYFETAGGGKVFSAGSISYTRSLTVDKNIQTITKNVLTEFLK